MAARRLQREVTESFITMIQTLSDTAELHAAGVDTVSRQRAIMLIGGLRELTAMTVESGGRMSDVTDEAVGAASPCSGRRAVRLALEPGADLVQLAGVGLVHLVVEVGRAR